MQFVPVNNTLRTQFFCFDKAFGDQEMDRMDRGLANVRLQQAEVGPDDEHGIHHKRRESRVAWIAHEPHNPESSWLYQAIMQRIHQANLALAIDIWGFAEELQYSVYEAPNGHYCWHMDSGISFTEKPRPPRKLSFTIQLSRPDEYDGGDLELLAFESDGKRMTSPRERGAMIVFPSYLTHRVNYVRRGTRRALVGWVCGPDFK
jgi:PKHD-type hydroxylase